MREYSFIKVILFLLNYLKTAQIIFNWIKYPLKKERKKEKLTNCAKMIVV